VGGGVVPFDVVDGTPSLQATSTAEIRKTEQSMRN
jgi:hypothetical protein